MSDAAKVSSDFSIGAVVRLRSGSPAMTVIDQSASGAPTIRTCWFHDGELRYGQFIPDTLTSGEARGGRI